MLNLYLAYINFCFISIVLTYCFRGSSENPLKPIQVIASTSTLLALIFILFGITWQVILVSIAIFIGAYLIIAGFDKGRRRYELFYQRKLEGRRELFRNLKDEHDKVSLVNKRLDKDISEIAKLYEITKEMSTTLLCSDIFEILAKFLRRNFLFKNCRLIIINKKESECTNRVYQIQGTTSQKSGNVIFDKPKIFCGDANETDLSLIEEMNNQRKIIKVSSFSEILDKEKPYIPKNVKSFLSTPIIVEKDLIGVISIENLPPHAFDSLLILNRQFILEMRKVRLYEMMQELAITDGLTGAYVRRHFLERLDEEFKRSKRHKFKFSFLMLDIDHFKVCNDTYGHLVGDAILRKVVDILKANIRQIDLVGRYGGEEFSVLLPETDKNGAFMVAERIRKAVRQEKFKVYDEFTNVSVSIGVATFPVDTRKKEELIEKADIALYRSKNEGRDRVSHL